MKVKEPWNRLNPGQFWREVDAEHNRIIAHELQGCTRVLDIGCGYGSLTNYLCRQGFQAIGIDENEESVEKAINIFPDLKNENIQVMGADKLGFHDNYFDAVVLRDALHHIYQEGDSKAVFMEIERILRPGGLLVSFDPQPNIVLLLARWMSRHADAQCSVQNATEFLTAKDWQINKVFFTECFALALSGGYVWYDFIPQWDLLHKSLIVLNRLASNLLNLFGIGRFFLWRYVITAKSPKI